MKKINLKLIKGLVIGFLLGFVPHISLVPIFQYSFAKNAEISILNSYGLRYTIIEGIRTGTISGLIVGLISSIILGVLFYIKAKNKKYYKIWMVISIVLYSILIMLSIGWFRFILFGFP